MLDYWKFDDQRSDEKLIVTTKRHPIFFAKAFIINIAIIIIVTAIILLIRDNLISLIAIISGLAIIFLVCYYYLYLWYNDVYVLTDERIIDVDQAGIFNRMVAETALDQIQEVKIEVKGPLESIFGFGKIVIQTAGPSENLVLELVPKPFIAQHAINNAMYEYRKKVGLDKEEERI